MPAIIDTIRHDGAIIELRLARAPVNALNPELCRAIADAVPRPWPRARRASCCRVERRFSAGLDVRTCCRCSADEVGAALGFSARGPSARAVPVPVAAALAGHAPAGGCVLALCCDYRVMASGGYRIGLNETQVGLVAPEGIQRLLRRAVGVNRAERLLVGGELVESERALAIGMVDELAEIDEVVVRARAWLEALLQLPRDPVLRTRAIARADLLAALEPEHIGLDRFIEDWYAPDTGGLRRWWSASARSDAQPAPVATGRAGSSIQPLHEPV